MDSINLQITSPQKAASKPNWLIIVNGWFFFVFILFLYGAIPFLMMPTLSTALWTLGFSQSFLNQSLLSVYAINFGFPHPAAIAFGLTGAYTSAVLMAIGLHAADAYSMMFVIWLALAFYGAYRLGLDLGLTEMMSLLAAVLWLSLPIVYLHVTFAMLALGIALLPFYFWMSIRLFYFSEAKPPWATLFGYCLTCLIAVFMDGFSFMMFATGSSILATYLFYRCKEKRAYFLKFALPFHFFVFVFSALLYMLFIRRYNYPLPPLQYFRASGIDLTFLLRPTQGIYWLWDYLHFSVSRSILQYFGFPIGWETAFSLPFIFLGGIAWWKIRKKNILASGFLLISIFGLWMAMGPSLKVNSKRTCQTPLYVMSSKHAVMPTGNALLSKYLPGFQEMRESYRWMALSLVGLWILQVIFFAQIQKNPCYRNNRKVIILLFMLILANLPHLRPIWHNYLQYWKNFYRLDHVLLPLMSSDLSKGNKVAFLPYRNDFLINYLAAKLQIYAYNISGDKNLAEARQYWPSIMQRFKPESVDPFFVNNVLLLLATGQVDVVVLPYISSVWNSEDWQTLSYHSGIVPVMELLEKISWITVQKRKYYAIAKLTPRFFFLDKKKLLCSLQKHPISLHVRLKENFFPEKTMTQVGLIKKGQVYSTGRAGVLLQGPYMVMEKGLYRLILFGSASNVSEAEIYIVSTSDSVIHTHFPFRKIKNIKEGILVSHDFQLNKVVDSFNIIVFVGKETKLQIKGYKLIQVDSPVTVNYKEIY